MKKNQRNNPKTDLPPLSNTDKFKLHPVITYNEKNIKPPNYNKTKIDTSFLKDYFKV